MSTKAKEAIYRDLLKRLTEIAPHVSWESGVCCCGAEMKDHGYFDNHSAVDSGEYAAEVLLKDVKAELGEEY